MSVHNLQTENLQESDHLSVLTLGFQSPELCLCRLVFGVLFWQPELTKTVTVSGDTDKTECTAVFMEEITTGERNHIKGQWWKCLCPLLEIGRQRIMFVTEASLIFVVISSSLNILK